MPTSTADSEFACVKRGTDTCVLQAKQYSLWDTFYIGVKCLQPCNFTLSTYYFTP